MQVLSTDPVNTVVVKKILGDRAKDEELGYEQQQALEHAEKFCKLEEKATAKLAEQLRTQEKLTPEAIVKITDLLPKYPDTLRAILLKDKIDLTDEEVSNVLQIVQKAL